MTRKLFYEDSHIKVFTAIVLSCEAVGGRYCIVLDQTAFFPGGGGQDPDTGKIGPASVACAFEKDGVIFHETDMPLEPGEAYACSLDWEKRFRRMQNHSGEHIISGIVFDRYGMNNVGFHMGDDCVTIDFDGELDRAQLDDIEEEANHVVASNAAILTEFPESETLKNMQYRSKIALSENVRIVTVAGYDRCACCAPHVSLAGEIGIIKVLDFMRHRSGIRLNLLCGLDALADYREKYRNIYDISGMLSAKQRDAAAAVSRLISEKETLEVSLGQMRRRIVALMAERLKPADGDTCLFEPDLDGDSLREIMNEGVKVTSGVFAGFSGSDGAGYRFIAGSERDDMSDFAAAMRAALGAKGGGSGRMIQGKVERSRAEIETFINKWRVK